MIEGETVFPFMLKGVAKRFQVSDIPKTAECVFIKEDMIVEVKFKGGVDPVITCNSFDLQMIEFSSENLAQARLEENLKTSSKTSEAIRKRQKHKTLLKSKRLKNVDLEALEKFFESQNK